MLSQNDNDVALTVLRKYDSYCQIVLDSCNKVKLYNYDKAMNNWVIKEDSEGAFYLVKRKIRPFYQFVILGKCNKPGIHPGTIEIPLSQYLVSQIHDNFYMIKSENGIIQAILFPSKLECDRFYLKVERLVSDLKSLSDHLSDLTIVNSKPQFIESIEGKLTNKLTIETAPLTKNGKLVCMLESAKQRYEDSHVEKYSRPIDIKELFKSTTTANHEAPSSVLVDSISFTQPTQRPVAELKDKNCQTNQNRLFGSFIPSIHHSHPPDMVESTPPITARNGANPLTVTELEKYFVQNASDQKIQEIEDDDDLLLFSPNKFEESDSVLNKEQLKDAFIYLLQNDHSGKFISELHAAYLQSVKQLNSAHK